MGSWIILSPEGKKLVGEIFPLGWIPIKSPFPTLVHLGDSEQTERAYLGLWRELSQAQRDGVLRILVERFAVSRDVIQTQFDKDGFFPLRERYVDGSGTDRPGLFIADWDGEDGLEEDEFSEDLDDVRDDAYEDSYDF